MFHVNLRFVFDIALFLMQLPGTFQRLPSKPNNYSKEAFLCSGELADRLKRLSIEEGVNLYVTLLAAFQTLLFRYTGQDNFAVNQVTVRTAFGTEGPQVPTEGIKSDLSGNPTFRQLLNRVRKTVLGTALQQRGTPPESANRGGWGLAMRIVDATTGLGESGLSVNISHESWGVSGRFVYGTLFDPETVDRMIGHCQVLLEGIAANPDQHITLLPILTDRETNQQLIEWNKTAAAYRKEKSIHELFEAQVERTPNNIALVFENQQLSYRDVNAKADRLADRLRTFGVGPETLVGLYVTRSLEMVVGLLGILKAGGAYLPLDPNYPKERLAFMLQDAQARVLVTQRTLLTRLPTGHGAQLLTLDGADGQPAEQTEGDVDHYVTRENLAYVMYTSGSTGKPKGIQITHGAVVNLLDSLQKQLRLKPDDRLLAVTTFCFDMSVVEFFLPLSVGASVVIASSEMVTDGNLLARQLSDPRITVMQGTPATWRLVLEGGWAGRDLTIISGGEKLPQELATRLLSKGASLWNMYGPTEITVYASTHRVLYTDTIVPIGRPIANTSVYVLDPQLQLVPVGIPGELYIGGSGLARGYLNRPELTAKNFVKHKFSNGQETRLYKTGDLARVLPDGKMEYLGRLDHQIKLRGFRIEPGEIETVLSDFPGVQEAIVLATESVPAEPKLVAYIVREPNQSVRVAELQSFLTAKLPDYMVPSAFVFLDKVSRTPNGKIDRGALPPPDPVRSASRDIFVAPRSSVEFQLASIWEKVLQIRPIGIRDNFFELGGHSLPAMRLLRQAERIFGKKLPINTIYKAPTVEQLARLLTEDVTPVSHSLLVPLQPYGSNPPFVWVHGEVSDGLLPRYLGREQPLFGFRHQSHDDRKPALYTTVRDIAAHCIDELLTVRPHGPYCLGGYCFGGIVALEMAWQLMERKHKVPLVALLDPDPLLNNGNPLRVPVTSRKDGIKPKSRALRRHLRNLRQLQFREQLEYIAVRSKQKIMGLWVRKISKMAKNVVCRVCLKFGFRLPSLVLSQYILGVYARALRDYVARPYSGQVIIFKTAGASIDTQVWQNVAIRGAEVHDVPGNHSEVLKEPHIRVWAEKLRIALDDAAATSRKSWQRRL